MSYHQEKTAVYFQREKFLRIVKEVGRCEIAAWRFTNLGLEVLSDMTMFDIVYDEVANTYTVYYTEN